MPHLSLHLWTHITNFGGAGLMLATSLLLAVWLTLDCTWRSGRLWICLLAAGAALVGITKIAFLGWGIGIRAWDFTGISGHSMLSTAVFPVTLYVLMLPYSRHARLLGVLAGLGCGLLVGLSRLVLNAHSLSETVAGCALGAAVALAFVACNRGTRATRLSSLTVALSLVVLTGSLYQFRLPTQRWVTHLALGLSGHDRPYVRASWRAGHRPSQNGGQQQFGPVESDTATTGWGAPMFASALENLASIGATEPMCPVSVT
jgi:hypothetical protein